MSTPPGGYPPHDGRYALQPAAAFPSLTRPAADAQRLAAAGHPMHARQPTPSQHPAPTAYLQSPYSAPSQPLRAAAGQNDAALQSAMQQSVDTARKERELLESIAARFQAPQTQQQPTLGLPAASAAAAAPPAASPTGLGPGAAPQHAALRSPQPTAAVANALPQPGDKRKREAELQPGAAAAALNAQRLVAAHHAQQLRVAQGSPGAQQPAPGMPASSYAAQYQQAQYQQAYQAAQQRPGGNAPGVASAMTSASRPLPAPAYQHAMPNGGAAPRPQFYADPNAQRAVAAATALVRPQEPAREDGHLPVTAPFRGAREYLPAQVDATMTEAQRANFEADSRRILPRLGLSKVLQRMALANQFQLSQEVEAHVMSLVEAMLDCTIEFGCLMASRRQSKWLEAKDVALYLERNWNIHLPGYGTRTMRPAPKVAPDALDTQRGAAVRESLGKLVVQPPPNRAGTGTAQQAQGAPSAQTGT